VPKYAVALPHAVLSGSSERRAHSNDPLSTSMPLEDDENVAMIGSRRRLDPGFVAVGLT
jgi:hypothetical protein